MKHVPRVKNEKLTLGLEAAVNFRRTKKWFSPRAYVEAKTRMLKAYFDEHQIKIALIAVSGGVDSAIVLGILSKIKSVTTIAITLPASNEVGATRQAKTVELAQTLEDAFDVHVRVFDIHSSIDEIQKGIQQAVSLDATPWSRGQSVAYTRTSALYSLTAALSNIGRTVLVGTTNRDEGSYLGYIGKASDGMVDIQPISDLHKSEVYKVATYLEVPLGIIEATPTGDMYDGRTDEEVFGAPYDFVELYTTLMHEAGDSYTGNPAELIPATLLDDDREQFLRFAMAIEELHKYNRHKYIGSSPAVHLDITPFDLRDGWQTNCMQAIKAPPLKLGYHVIHKPTLRDPLPHVTLYSKRYEKLLLPDNGFAFCIKGVLSESNVNELLELGGDWMQADEHGKIDSKGSGSLRKHVMMSQLAKQLYNSVSIFLPNLYEAGTSDDLINDGLAWSRTRMNPYFRFIKYVTGGWLVPHYDDAYRETSVERSLLSVVIYLTKGTTRFLRETRAVHNFTDQEFAPMPENILLEVDCNPGDILVFEHRLLHDCPRITKEKVIIRTDIMYQKPQLGRALSVQSR